MKALVWHGKEDIRCDTVSDPEMSTPATLSSGSRAAPSAVRIYTQSGLPRGTEASRGLARKPVEPAAAAEAVAAAI